MVDLASAPCAPGRKFQPLCIIDLARRGRRGWTAPPAVAGLGCWDRVVDDDAELRWVGVALITGDEEVLRTRWLEREQQPHLVAADPETVPEDVRKRRVRPGLDLDRLVTDVGGDRAVENVEGLVFTRVGVERRLFACAHPQLDNGPVAT